jgi:hypothetical protein
MAAPLKASQLAYIWPHWLAPDLGTERTERFRVGRLLAAAEPPDRCLTASELIRIARWARVSPRPPVPGS